VRRSQSFDRPEGKGQVLRCPFRIQVQTSCVGLLYSICLDLLYKRSSKLKTHQKKQNACNVLHLTTKHVFENLGRRAIARLPPLVAGLTFTVWL